MKRIKTKYVLQTQTPYKGKTYVNLFEVESAKANPSFSYLLKLVKSEARKNHGPCYNFEFWSATYGKVVFLGANLIPNKVSIL